MQGVIDDGEQKAAVDPLTVLSPLLNEKSVISIIHEKAQQLKLKINFEVLEEGGDQHNRQYAVRYTLVADDNVVKAKAMGKGKNKKSAQQEACTQLLATVEHLTLAANVRKTEKKQATMKKDEEIDVLNPVAQLNEYAQKFYKKYPTFEFVKEQAVGKHRVFIIQATFEDKTLEGRGPSKMIAKRAAAEAILESIGFIKPSLSIGACPGQRFRFTCSARNLKGEKRIRKETRDNRYGKSREAT